MESLFYTDTSYLTFHAHRTHNLSVEMHMQLRGSLIYEQIIQNMNKWQEIQSKGNSCALTFIRENFLEKKLEEIMVIDWLILNATTWA